MPDAVKDVKRVAEAAILHLVETGSATVDLSEILSLFEASLTTNQSGILQALFSLVSPAASVTYGPTWDEKYHAGWAEPGETLTGLEGGRRMSRLYLKIGVHGPGEFAGYADLWLLIYTLMALNRDPETQSAGRRLLWGDLALFRLLNGHEIGCRSGGFHPEPNATGILALLRGEEPHVGRSDFLTALRIFAKAQHLLDPPSLATVEDAVAVIRDSGVRCAPGFEWRNYGPARWGAIILDRGACVKKATLQELGGMMEHGKARIVAELPGGALRSLRLTSDGPVLSGDWSLPVPHEPEEPAPGEPPEPPPPVEPEPIKPEPTPPKEYPFLAEARAKAEELHGMLSRHGEKKLALEVRKALRQHALKELGLADEEEGP